MVQYEMNISLKLRSPDISENLVRAIEPEIIDSSEKFDRSTLTVKTDGSSILIRIKASDVIAAKAALNSILTWINSSNLILEYFS